jgi:hypothetical protein
MAQDCCRPRVARKTFSDVGIISGASESRSVDQGGEMWVIRGIGERAGKRPKGEMAGVAQAGPNGRLAL